MKKRYAVLFLFLSLSFIAARHVDAYPRDVKWREFQTDHFRVIFGEPHRKEAEEIARMAEAIHQDMSRVLEFDDEINTTLIVTDQSDAADLTNTSMFRRPGDNIVMQLGDMEAGWPTLDAHVSQWMMMQFISQYAMMMRHSNDSWLRALFSSVYLDDGFSGWMEGGMGTYMASLLLGEPSRAPYADMALRAEAMEGGLKSLGERAVIGMPPWPGDPGVFAYGFAFFRYLADTYGAQTLAQLNRAQSNNIPFPFLTKDAFAETYGKSLEAVEQEWLASMQTVYARQIESIQASPLTASMPLTSTGSYTHAPRLSPDGQFVYYVEATPHASPALMRLRLSDGEKTRLLSGDFGESFSLTADGRALYFSKTETYHAYYQRSDLYRLDLSNGRVTRLTRGERAFDPAVSPDGSAVVYVKREGASSLLMRLDLQSGERTQFAGFADYTLIQRPAFSADGSKLAARVMNHDGTQSIAIIQADGSSSLFVNNLGGAPCWGLNDRYLFVHSDLTGVSNIFAYDMTDGASYQVTNVLTGAFEPCVSPDGSTLIFAYYSRAGFDLHQTPLAQDSWQPVGIPGRSPSVATTNAPAEIGKETGYKAYSTLFPLPFPIWGNDEDGLQLGLNLSAGDPLEQHQYSVSLLYGLESSRIDINGQYVNNQWYPTISLFGYDQGWAYGDLFENPQGKDADYWERRTGGGIEIGFPLYRTNRTDFSLAAGYEYEERERLTKFEKLAMPYPDEGALGSASSRFILRSYDEYPLSISPEKGTQSSVRYRRYDEMFGSDFTIDEVVGDVNLFLPMPFRHHVLFLRGAGGMSDGDTLQQGLFQIGGSMINVETNIMYEPHFSLRGYESNAFRGDRFMLATAEYRLPLWYVQRSLFDGQAFLDSLSGSVFFETGDAWKDDTEDLDLKSSIGGDLAARARFRYGRLGIQGHVGVAHGLDKNDGETQVYFKARFLF